MTERKGYAELTITQGDDFQALVRVVNNDNEDLNIDAYTAQAQLRRNYADDDEDVAAEFDCEVKSPHVVLTLTHDVTAQLAGLYVWDCQLVNADGVVTTVIRGNALVDKEVTR